MDYFVRPSVYSYVYSSYLRYAVISLSVSIAHRCTIIKHFIFIFNFLCAPHLLRAKLIIHVELWIFGRWAESSVNLLSSLPLINNCVKLWMITFGKKVISVRREINLFLFLGKIMMNISRMYLHLKYDFKCCYKEIVKIM